MKTLRILSLLVLLVLLVGAVCADAESRDYAPVGFPSAFVLSKGVLQAHGWTSYIDLRTARLLGADLDKQAAGGVGTFLEEGGQVQFGFAPRWDAAFRFSSADFDYGAKEATVGSQDLRLKRLLWSRDAAFLALEAGWQRHAVNKLRNSGVDLAMSNVLHDHGWGLKLLGTRAARGPFDLHAGLGADFFPVDGDGGQRVLAGSLGTSAFWGGRWQADATISHQRVKRDAPRYSASSSGSNTCLDLGFLAHLTDAWGLFLRGRVNDHLFRGIWPFLDREVSRLDLDTYGYFSLGFSYRHDYGR